MATNIFRSSQPLLVYDVIRGIDLYGIRLEIEFLKLTNLPILLVGNNYNAITADPLKSNDTEMRLVYRAGLLLKDIYKLSSFFEFSVGSEEDVNGLFITAIDLAFRYKM
ncbi:hypothetical protein AVEN_26693-1 [Araneus ventricosus]|uniref:Uncharacterized protein n=1 Tax=Araneus ventricosus TaxID=182803 RepID=A0A4Y2RIN0_ARAVE|nr:hypothetical protein AVEN_26693-1 [Araneus ventricosus]